MGEAKNIYFTCLKCSDFKDVDITTSHVPNKFEGQMILEIDDLKYEITEDNGSAHQHLGSEDVIATDEKIMTLGCPQCGLNFSDGDLLTAHQECHLVSQETSSITAGLSEQLTDEHIYSSILSSSAFEIITNPYENESQMKIQPQPEDGISVGMDTHQFLRNICPFCRTLFSSQKIGLHIASYHTPNGSHFCNACHHSFRSQRSLERHYCPLVSSLPYACACGNFQELDEFLSHITKVHVFKGAVKSGKTSKPKSTIITPRTIVCSVCPKRFNSQIGLKLHARRHREAKFRCELCEQTFEWLTHFNAHCARKCPGKKTVRKN